MIDSIPMEKIENRETEQKKALEESLRQICFLLADVKDDAVIYDFFNCLFTPSELEDFAKRWLLVCEIDAGTSQREIAKKFSISLCKITRGSKELKKPDSAFRKFLEIAKNLRRP